MRRLAASRFVRCKESSEDLASIVHLMLAVTLFWMSNIIIIRVNLNITSLNLLKVIIKYKAYSYLYYIT